MGNTSNKFVSMNNASDDPKCRGLSNVCKIIHYGSKVTHAALEHIFVELNINGTEFWGVDTRFGNELQKFFSEQKATLSKTCEVLTLFENYLLVPSEETAKPLKRFFDGEVSTSNESFTEDDIEDVWRFIGPHLVEANSQDSNENSNEIPLDSQNRSFNSSPLPVLERISEEAANEANSGETRRYILPPCERTNQSNRGQEQQQKARSNDQGKTVGNLVKPREPNEREVTSVSSVPPAPSVIFNNYKLLLLSLDQMLLSSEVTKLMTWATQNFPIVNPQNATHVLLQLDENEVINASDLSQLRHFFESIARFDLVYVIDTFLLGDYGILRQITASKKRDVNTQQTSQTGTTTRYQNLFNAASNSQFSLRDSSLTAENSNEPQSSVLQQKQQPFPTLVLNQPTPNNAKFVPRSPHENHSTVYEQQSLKSGATGFTASQQVVVGSHVTNERRTTTGNSSTNANSSATSNPRNTQTIGSNGSRLSTLRRNQEQSDNWLCSHYKRHCYVKFECCDQFWPCHRCHNNQSTCGRKKLKSRDTQMVKCVYCNKVQQFGEHCCDCGAKFASYYCGKCKHLTGTDDHPYHCEKCGICRIHGDRSFHCDICGVCLDVQLRGNHKCREGSAHDECCICLEDAFTGCQILPCSHKVHKECATQMIRCGITRCPICRESFAHKLERRPLPNSRKRGK